MDEIERALQDMSSDQLQELLEAAVLMQRLEAEAKAKKKAKRIAVVIMVVGVILALAMCIGIGFGIASCVSGSGKESPKVANQPDTVWVKRVPKADFSAVVFTAKTEAELKLNGYPDDLKERNNHYNTNVTQEVKDSFAAANKKYKKGDYEEALADYKAILEGNLLYYPANMNATLAMMQLGQHEEALRQALVTLILFEDEAAYINAQAAAVGAGYSVSDVCNEFLTQYFRGLLKDPLLVRLSDYNELWDAIDTDLDDMASVQFGDFNFRLKTLATGNPDDRDIAALNNYLKGVGILNNLEE